MSGGVTYSYSHEGGHIQVQGRGFGCDGVLQGAFASLRSQHDGCGLGNQLQGTPELHNRTVFYLNTLVLLEETNDEESVMRRDEEPIDQFHRRRSDIFLPLLFLIEYLKMSSWVTSVSPQLLINNYKFN